MDKRKGPDIEPKEFAFGYPDVLRAEEVAEILRIGRSTVYKLLTEPDFPSVKVGTRVVVYKEALREWLARKSMRTAPNESKGGNELERSGH